MLTTMTAPPQQRPDHRTGPRISKPERAARAARVLRLRNANATWEQIADQLQITINMAKGDFTFAIKEWVKVPAEQMVDRQRAILLDIVRVEYPAAMDPASPRHYQAQDKILECLRDEARLFGLNAPQRVTLGISEEEFAKQAAELLAVTGPKPLLELARRDAIEAEVVEAAAEDEPPWSNL